MALWIHNYSAYGRRKLWKAAGSVSFPMSDNQGVRMVITMDGDSAGSESYNSYGVSTGSTESHFGFSGGYAEPTGIVYLVHRFYDPQSGQLGLSEILCKRVIPTIRGLRSVRKEDQPCPVTRVAE